MLDRLASNRFVGYLMDLMHWLLSEKTRRFARFARVFVRTVYGFILMAVLMGMAGCATSSTVATRKVERAAAYGALPPEEQALVDQGQIRVGMNPDAVYVAWGQPAQVLKSGDATGEITTWLYTSTTSDTYRSWHYREYPRRDGSTYLDRSLDVDYAFRDYVSAELVFRNGKLERWRMLPKPMERDILSPGPYGR
jgi:outer membrane protein assembly factor BamE (lipoprotein component of BamABCDE complex)